jgi:hypothetical protein
MAFPGVRLRRPFAEGLSELALAMAFGTETLLWPNVADSIARRLTLPTATTTTTKTQARSNLIYATQHSPLIGFAYDGYPIYGAYGYTGTNGTGAITRMKSSYKLKSMTTRTNGPAVSTTYPLGYFKEDYEFVAGTTSDYLDVHNGRFCVTPEYPNGTYAYFCTVDANHNSAYPYVVGPTFYGVVSAGKVASITETTTTYNPVSGVEKSVDELAVNIYPNPANEYLFVQIGSIVEADASIALYDINGRLLQKSTIVQGSTIGHLDTRTYYEGHYILKVTSGKDTKTFNVVIAR